MNDVERNARLTNLEHKITGTNNEILTGLSMWTPWSMSWEESSVGRWPNICIHVQNHGKHDQHYLIYKFTCFLAIRVVINVWVALWPIPTPVFSRVECIFHLDWRPSGTPTPVILNLNDPMPLGKPPCLIRCKIEDFVYLSCCSPSAPPPLPLRPSQECVRKVDFRHLTKNHEFPSKGFSPNHCFFILSMINARFGMYGQYH